MEKVTSNQQSPVDFPGILCIVYVHVQWYTPRAGPQTLHQLLSPPSCSA